MDRRAFLATFGLLAAPRAGGAQQAWKVGRVGILRPGAPPDPYVEAFRQGLHELGYAEDRNIVLEYRWAEGRDERLPDLAADLARLKVNVIVASGAASVLAARGATVDIPIVMPVIGDPVRLGLAASYARPAANVTGFAVQNEDLAGKWMQLLKEAVPRITRVALLSDPASVLQQVRTAERAARSLGVHVHVVNVNRPDALEAAFAEAKRNRAEALIVLGSPFFSTHRTSLVRLAARHRLPTMYHQREFVVGSGGLMSYGADFHDLFRRAAVYVDKILKGAKPADLPIEQPTKFELVINLKTAKALGLTIPPSLLQRADQVIE